jgi:hypothetical protein
VAKFELLPTIVHLHDDWQDSKSPPNLTFSVDAGNFTGVLRLQMIAELLERFYDVLDLVERQHFIANQRSESFRSRTVQRNNEPSPIAVALMQSMQKVGKQMVDGEELDFAQVMHFRLAGINLGVFNNDDVQQVDELYHFVVGVMEVELTSVPKRTDGVQQQGRDLKVNVGAMRWDSQDNSHWSAEHDKAEMTPEEVLVKVLGRKMPILVAKVPSLVSFPAGTRVLMLTRRLYTYPPLKMSRMPSSVTRATWSGVSMRSMACSARSSLPKPRMLATSSSMGSTMRRSEDGDTCAKSDLPTRLSKNPIFAKLPLDDLALLATRPSASSNTSTSSRISRCLYQKSPGLATVLKRF